MKTVAIVLLAGNSKRFHCATPKQFFEVSGKPLAYYSIKPFVDSKVIKSIVIVSKDEYLDRIKDICKEFDKKIDFVKGGETRYESVSNAINFLENKLHDTDNVLIHDGARLFLEENQIEDLVDYLKEYNAATLAIPMEDTLGVIKNGEIQEIPDRSKYMKIQTPQAFKFKTIKLAHELPVNNPTDDTQLCLSIGCKVAVVAGSKKLNKVTTLDDIGSVKVNLEDQENE
jgi:2-C-methyl-D-erythritol 4-phosphate cytidylyltransferase